MKQDAKKADKTAKQETAKTATVEVTTKEAKETKQPKTTNALESVGKAAIKEHGCAQVFVTSDGVAFFQECDAKNHAANLKNKSITTVKK